MVQPDEHDDFGVLPDFGEDHNLRLHISSNISDSTRLSSGRITFFYRIDFLYVLILVYGSFAVNSSSISSSFISWKLGTRTSI